jgi:integrase
MESDLIFIEEHLEFKVIKSVYTHDVVHLSKANWTQAIRLLKETMYVAYGSTMMSNLIDDVTNNTFDAARRFTDACNKTAEANEWQKRTAMSTLSNLKKILRKLALADEFIDKLQIRSNDGVSRSSNEYCLPSIYKKLPPEDPIKNLLIDWITKCKQQTRNKSQSSVKQIIGFAIHLCKALGYDISPGAARESFDKCNADKLTFATLKLALERLKSGFSKTMQMRFLLVIIPIFFNNKTITESDIRTVSAGDAIRTKEFIQETDTHRLSNGELTLMYEASKTNKRSHAIFLLMATTGLRVGGVSNILLKNVARFVNNNIIINSDGRTLEKGKKWFAFVICDKLRDALTDWIQERPINSEYLFPGRGSQPLCTSRISKIIKEIADDAKVTGPHVHAHSIRHSFAHILLEAGNDPSKVSKMIGHASTATTEKYYLKESAVEVSKRCNIPWLTRTEQIDPLPSFMKPTTSAKSISIQNRAKKKDKQMRLKVLSKSFNTVGEPISE